MEVQILRIGNNTNIHAAATAVSGYLQANKHVMVDCIGISACYQGIRALILARSKAMLYGRNIAFTASYITLETDPSITKTGIRFQIVILSDK